MDVRGPAGRGPGELPLTPRGPLALVLGNGRLGRALVATGLAFVVLSHALLVGLHLLPDLGGVDPVRELISDYALGPTGWVFSLALCAGALGSAALVLVLSSLAVLHDRATRAAMAVWCVGLVGVAVVPPGRLTVGVLADVTVAAHFWLAATTCVSLPVAGVAVGWRHRRHDHWRRFALPTLGLCLADALCLLPIAVTVTAHHLLGGTWSLASAFGLLERLAVMLDTVVLVVLGLWAWHSTGPGRDGQPDGLPAGQP
ncbi:Protein of unknown function (DUF998) [Streptoalloteichus tenebrarius]|uniref:DUF998 domain-containing protein n=1 Tax=Streptoalloteichus tenebrarius (strain ATCC 17920 / DSM 40477 / JCM 4838 / CBS 697.72 / NBRC 16177 / NCIMB 11028 / NRRL B-12390 / A12253. 1 / ISP 5477) TaxID=1933 RepID=A0ABT1HXY3_STRSD|nr:DUF998 domain-containing protein [Streptoalloteichus tenebrarius]MCP2260376.1 Protein of unknown function (DUF998) [Streptoalloteichus tenebrarius]